MGGEKSVRAAVDCDVFDGVFLTDGVNDVLASSGFSKNGMFAVEVRSWAVGDEELRAIGVGASVGHGEYAGFVVATVGFAFAFKFVTWVSSAGAERAAALDHEVINDAVKGESIVVSRGGEMEEGGDGDGSIVGEGCDLNVAFVGVDGDFNVVHV